MTAAPITVCVSTYGPDRERWAALAKNRALPSVDANTLQPADVRWFHGKNLCEARNTAAKGATTEWLCFLDADDSLDAGYLAAMSAAIETLPVGRDWLLQPATLGVHADGHEDPEPVLIPRKPLIDGNFMVIGTLIRTAQFERIGGFHDWNYAEDWELWLRAWIDGAGFEAVPEAIYRVHVNPSGRNSCSRAQQVQTYQQIRNRHLAAARHRARNG